VIIKYEGQEVDSTDRHLYKIDNEVRFINADGYKKIVFEHDQKAVLCLSVIIKAREAGFNVLDLSEVDDV
jgi:hypothetical protein